MYGMRDLAWGIRAKLPGRRELIYDFACGILVAGMLVLVVFTFRDYGISNDEEAGIAMAN
jgi:hypothetical protein